MKLVISNNGPFISSVRDGAKPRAKDVGINHIICNEFGKVALFHVARLGDCDRYHLSVVDPSLAVADVVVEEIDSLPGRRFNLLNSLFPERSNDFFSDPVEMPGQYCLVRLSFRIDETLVKREFQI